VSGWSSLATAQDLYGRVARVHDSVALLSEAQGQANAVKKHDTLWLADIGVRVKPVPQIKLAFDHETKTYDTLNTINVVRNEGKIYGTWKRPRHTYKLYYEYGEVALNQKAYLTKQTVKPRLQWGANQRRYSAALAYRDYDYDVYNKYDTLSHAVEADMLVKHGGGRSHKLKAEWREADAWDNHYDYRQATLTAETKHPFAFLRSSSYTNLRVDYRDRDYHKVTTDDQNQYIKRWRVRGDIYTPLGKGLKLRSRLTYADHQTNLPATDYHDIYFELAVIYRGWPGRQSTMRDAEPSNQDGND